MSIIKQHYFRDNNFTLYNSECIELMQQIDDNTIDVIFADPPYLLSNDGFTCKNGKMSSVNKSDWEKLKSLLFCAVSWNGNFNTESILLKVQSFDFMETDTLINEIKKDYEYIRNKCTEQGFSSLTGKDGKWIQARTKGAGHGSQTRAFYGRKELINEIINL